MFTLTKSNILKTFSTSFFILLFSITSFAQSDTKLKGNKIIERKNYDATAFKIIEIGDNFEVKLIAASSPGVTIETDSNLHDAMNVSVDAEKLSIKTNGKIIKSKKLYVEVNYTPELSKIIAHGKAEITSASIINVERLAFETSGNASLKIDTKADRIDVLTKGNSEIKGEFNAESVAIHANDNSKIDANSKIENLSIAQNQKSEVSIYGEAIKNTLFLLDDTYFYGAELITTTTNLTIETESSAYVNVTDKLELKSSGSAKTAVLGNPVIDLKSFQDESSLKKLIEAPGKLKRLLK